MTELTDLIDQMDITHQVIIEACAVRDKTKRAQTIYVWNVTADSYNYIICDAEDKIPDIVTHPATKRDVVYPYGENHA